MRDYRYRHAIRDDAEYAQSPVLRAAFAVAQAAHHGQSRFKSDPTIGYLTHPIMVYDLLRYQGMHDPKVLGAALLHDVREMCEPYASDPLSLVPALKTAIMAEGMTGLDAGFQASDMAAMVEQMTNHGTRYESKGMTQMKRAQTMSVETKLIKIADQTASLICNQMMENSGRFRESRAQQFAQKAYSLVKAIANDEHVSAPERAQVQKAAALFMAVYDANKELLLAAPAQKQQLRAQFTARMEQILHRASIMDAPSYVHKRARHVMCDKRAMNDEERSAEIHGELEAYGMPQLGGVVRVDFNEQGDVIGFLTWAAPEDKPGHFRNRMQDTLLQFLHRGLQQDVETSPTLQKFNLHNGDVRQEGRYHQFTRPMKAKDFAIAALHASAILPEEASRIVEVAQDLARDYYFLRPGFQ